MTVADPRRSPDAADASDARDREDFEFLAGNARVARAQRVDRFTHLDQPIGIWNYIRIANEIAAAMPSGRLLDWGCGFGQMTWLLRRRGLAVTPFDVRTMIMEMPDLPLTRGLDIVWGTDPTALPFAAGSFDAVLSCGVLEHVDEHSAPGNERLSLREIQRVLVPSGRFFVYQLPQRFAWQEAITRQLRHGYAHPRRYTAREITDMLAAAGFRVERIGRRNMLPKNLTGVPERLRTVYSRFSHAILRADAAISAVPLLNQVAGVLEIVARRVP